MWPTFCLVGPAFQHQSVHFLGGVVGRRHAIACKILENYVLESLSLKCHWKLKLKLKKNPYLHQSAPWPLNCSYQSTECLPLRKFPKSALHKTTHHTVTYIFRNSVPLELSTWSESASCHRILKQKEMVKNNLKSFTTKRTHQYILPLLSTFQSQIF